MTREEAIKNAEGLALAAVLPLTPVSSSVVAVVSPTQEELEEQWLNAKAREGMQP